MVIHDPEVCTCTECSMRLYDVINLAALEEIEEMSAKKYNIPVQKVRDLGEMPAFLGVVHRHFQKAIPPVKDPKNTVYLTAPLDLIGMLVPPSLLSGISQVELIYRKGG